MTACLLVWLLVAPSLPFADADSRNVATGLRRRVLDALVAPTLAALLLWVVGCGLGLLAAASALVCAVPKLALLGPASAMGGAFMGWLVLLHTLLDERRWVGRLGLPPDWRQPWLAGELEQHLAGKRSPDPTGSSREVTPVERWWATPGDATEWVRRDPVQPEDDGAGEEAVLLDSSLGAVKRTPILRFVDAARMRTPPFTGRDQP